MLPEHKFSNQTFYFQLITGYEYNAVQYKVKVDLTYQTNR